MRTTIVAFIALTAALVLATRLLRELAEAAHGDVPTALDDEDENENEREDGSSTCGSWSHGYVPSEGNVLSGRVM